MALDSMNRKANRDTSYKAIVVSWGLSAALFATLAAQQLSPGQNAAPILVVPTIELTAIIGASVAVGMLLNRVRTLEREMREVRRWMYGSSHKRETDRGDE